MERMKEQKVRENRHVLLLELYEDVKVSVVTRVLSFILYFNYTSKRTWPKVGLVVRCVSYGWFLLGRCVDAVPFNAERTGRCFLESQFTEQSRQSF